jgi:Predicted membrane protein
MKNKLRLIIQIIAGIIFIISGALKAIDSQSFSSLISAYGFGWAGSIAPVISSIEIILGLCLILNIQPRTTVLFSTAITIVFTLLFSYAFFFRGIEDCGCTGSFLKVSLYISLSRNVLIIIGCLWIWYNFKEIDVQTKNWKKWTVYVLGGISLCVSGYTLGKPLVEKVEKYTIHEGDQINTTVFQCFNDKISKDTCIIFIFSPDCIHCWNVTENIKSIKRTPGFTNVIGITYFDSDTTRYMKEMKPNFEVLKYPTDELYDYVFGVPVFLVLKDGKVIKRIKPEDIPCGPMLRRMFE